MIAVILPIVLRVVDFILKHLPMRPKAPQVPPPAPAPK